MGRAALRKSGWQPAEDGRGRYLRQRPEYASDAERNRHLRAVRAARDREPARVRGCRYKYGRRCARETRPRRRGARRADGRANMIAVRQNSRKEVVSKRWPP